MTFGVPELLDGVNVVLVAVALFAVGETLLHGLAATGAAAVVRPVGSIMMSRERLEAQHLALAPRLAARLSLRRACRRAAPRCRPC